METKTYNESVKWYLENVYTKLSYLVTSVVSPSVVSPTNPWLKGKETSTVNNQKPYPKNKRNKQILIILSQIIHFVHVLP